MPAKGPATLTLRISYARRGCLSPLLFVAIVSYMAKMACVDASLRTDQGRVRSNNEDFVARHEPDGAAAEVRDGWLYILADGAGGMDAGDVASRFATERTLHHYLERAEQRDWSRRLYEAMQAANQDLRRLSTQAGKNNRMATTMVAVVIAGERAHVANVGDSRAYLWHRRRLQQITKDQSLVAKLLEEGAITAEEAADHPRKNIILYSLGSEREPRVDLFELPLEAGDRLLLCSDGLTRHVSDEEIAVVLSEREPEAATETLIDLANERGGRDNISVGVVHYGSEGEEEGEGERTTGGALSTSTARVLLWSYTLFLSLIQTLLMVLIWAFLKL